jgi:colanic acid/amylovoran biosynthesis protein
MGASLATGNRGVSALGASLVGLLRKTAPETEPIMLIGSRNDNAFEVRVGNTFVPVKVFNFRLSAASGLAKNVFVILFLSLLYRIVPLKPFRRLILRRCKWLEVVAAASLVGDIRGGDSFSDIYGARNFILASLPVLSVIWTRGSIALFPQTYGPFKTAVCRSLAKYILRHADPILARDHQSEDAVRELIGEAARIHFCPDVAFSLEAVKPGTLDVSPPLPEKGSACLIGLNVNGLMYNGGYTRSNMFGLKLDYNAFLGRLVTNLLSDENNRLLLVPHTFAPPGNVESDPEASRRVLEGVDAQFRSRIHLITREYDQHEIKGLIGDCDFFIGSRMHSCIAALSQGIPTVGVAYSKKFRGVFESVGAGQWVIDGRYTATDEALSLVQQLFHERAQIGEKLKTEAQNARELLLKCFLLFQVRPHV